jgi:hypothetical protein
MSERVLRLLVVAHVVTIAVLLMVLLIVYTFAVPVVNKIAIWLLIVVIFSGVCTVTFYSLKVQSVRMKEMDHKQLEALMERHPSEEVLGCIQVQRMADSLLKASETRELFVITSDKVFIVEIAEVTPRSRMDYSYSVTTTLKADEKVVPNSEIRKVELKLYPPYLLTLWELIFFPRIRLSIVTREREYKWLVIGPFPEKNDVMHACIEDYENMLRPIFGDKLTVKK